MPYHVHDVWYLALTSAYFAWQFHCNDTLDPEVRILRGI